MLGVKRKLYAASVSALALWTAAACVHAEDAAKAAPKADQTEIIVTGSRIISRGFTQPTPTTTLTPLEIAKAAQPNVFNTVTQLPSLQGSTGRVVWNNSTSSGMQGLSSFSLRGLGPIRTLTLLDGQRMTPANVTGVVDVSQFPQLLMKRVDVVTGGASASYGSDAIGGVVNFITDKRFVGLKTNIEAGQTTYGDDQNFTAQVAWGKAFLNDRLHVEASGEYSREAGLPSGGYGVGDGASGRTWFVSPAFQVRSISQTTDGKPQYIYIQQAQQYQYAKYGLITSGPLQGTAFGAGGQPYQFQYGSNGVPTGTGAVTNCISSFCVGGDLSGAVGEGTTYVPRLSRTVAYTRMGYDINDNTELYVSANFAKVMSMNIPNVGAAKNANLTIQCSNPFVPASIQTACANNGITSFQYGTTNAEFPDYINVHANRRQERFVTGLSGSANLLGTRWTYDAYVAHGTNHTSIDVYDISLTPRYNAAIDAVAGPNGTVVCRNTAAAAAGCRPLNIIGNVTIDPAALAYVIPGAGPQQRSIQTEDVASINFSGSPFSLWAGPVDVATGLEYRREAYKTKADPYGNGVTADTPNTSAYPADPVLNTAGNNWYAGNYHNGQGSYNVAEAYLELNVPVFDTPGLGSANLNLAGRQTHYSTSGDVQAWKVGATWKTGIDGLRFRAVTSQDVRAPNLSELFAAPVVTNNIVNSNGTAITILNEVLGNPDLKPEIARNSEIGIVLSQPQWLPGLSVSVDYYNIDIQHEISSLSAQQEVDLCAAGNTQICGSMLLTSTVPNTNYVKVQAFNVAKAVNRGYDIEVQYRTGLSAIHLPGTFTARALATHTISFKTDSGVLGTIPTEAAGVNLGNTPYWKALFTQGWDTDKASLTVTERWFSDGHYSNEYIECQTSCPVSTVTHPTINNNQMKGATYVDLGGTYALSDRTMAYFKIDNLFNRAPAPAPQAGVGIGANPYLYDLVGREYRAGVRMNF